MMTKNKLKNGLKSTILLVVLAGLFLMVGCKVKQKDTTIIPIVKTPSNTQTPAQISPDTDQDSFFITVEVMPSFPGGIEARGKYLNDNIKYPDEAIKAGIQGTCYMNFVVETDGRITNVRVLRGIGGGCDEEAIRVIQDMPEWEPGLQRGKPVRVQYNMPIKFTLTDDNKKK